MLKKLKSFLADERSWYGFLLVTVAVVSFWLGQASVPPTPAATVVNPVTIIPAATNAEELADVEELSLGEVVASRSGTRYHLPNCPGAAQIKPENLIRFPSVAAAEAAGYTPASNCPDLE